MTTTTQASEFEFVGTDDFTGHVYAFSLEEFEYHEDYEGYGPAVECDLVTENGRMHLVEWVNNERVARTSPDSNIVTNIAGEVAELFEIERPSFAPIDAYIPSALFDALEKKLEENS